MSDFEPGTRIRTRIDDEDTDSRGERRAIPAGTCGTIIHVAEGVGEVYDIVWDNGGWTSWDLQELRDDAEILNC